MRNNILIIYEDVGVTTFLKTYLHDANRNIDIAHSNSEIISLLKLNTYHVVLTDIAVAGTSGNQLIEVLNSHLPSANIYILSDMDQEIQRQTIEKFGIEGFIDIPIHLESLSNILQDSLV